MESVTSWASSAIRRIMSEYPYHYLQVKVLGTDLYAPFIDFARDKKYFADLHDYLDDSIFQGLLTIFASENTYATAAVLTAPSNSGRIWTQPDLEITDVVPKHRWKLIDI